MLLDLRCPRCEADISTPSMNAGMEGRCPHCAARYVVPRAPSRNTAPPTLAEIAIRHSPTRAERRATLILLITIVIATLVLARTAMM